MTVTETNREVGTDPVDELLVWLEANWDPDLTVREWWDRLATAGWAAPMLPVDCYGRGLSRGDAMRVQRAIVRFGALGAPAGMGISMVSPTIATHGTREQIDRYVPDAISGKLGWCQLFSEPGAGSDLAGLSTKAVRQDDEWIINGQKVWTSGGHRADMGMLLARTDPTAPKHQGISWFAFNMRQPGVEVRPLREMTGNTMFSEVFFTDARVSNDAIIGAVNDGWKAANTTLFHERSGMGAGGGARDGQITRALAGTISGHLDRRAGDFLLERPSRKGSGSAAPARKSSSPAQQYIELARTFGKDKDPVIRQGLAQLHIYRELARLTTERHKAVRAAGGDIPGVPNFSKLLMGHTVRHTRDLGMQILGARGLLHVNAGDEGDVSGEFGGRAAVAATAQALGAQALPIFGGTDQIQMNIIGERVLGLPKDPGDLSTVPFNELPRNG
jgi:alkylation response protein AidB-like acyl-CoA dehydrogenase